MNHFICHWPLLFGQTATGEAVDSTANTDSPIPDKTGEVDVSVATVRETIDNLIDGFMDRLPLLVIGAVFFVIFYMLASFARRVIRSQTKGKNSENVGRVLGRVAQWSLIFVGLLACVAIVAPSVTPAKLLTSLGVGGVAIGFAFKDILQNFMAGLLILLREPFKIGDQIVSGDFEGTVTNIETRATTIKTYDGRLVVIPNSQIYTNPVVVNTAFENQRTQYDIGIGYGDDLREAKRVILNAMRSVEGVLTDPAPDVLVVELAGSTVNLRARWWTAADRATVVNVGSDVIAAIKEALDEAQIDMPYPTQVLLFHDQTEETDGDRARQREGWPAGKNPPEPRKIAGAIERFEMSSAR